MPPHMREKVETLPTLIGELFMLKTKSLIAVAVIAFSLAPSAFAKQSPPIPNTGGMPAACPSMDDVVDTLKFADANKVILRLREDAKVTRNRQCEGYTKIIEGGLSSALLAVTSQQQSRVCQAYDQPDVKSAFAATLLVGMMYKSAPCSAFK